MPKKRPASHTISQCFMLNTKLKKNVSVRIIYLWHFKIDGSYPCNNLY